MRRTPGAGQAIQRHSHEGLQGVRPLLSNLRHLPAPQKRLVWGRQINSLVQCHYNYCPMTCLLLFCTQTAIIVYQMWLYVYQLLMSFIACKNTVACWAQHADAATVALPFPHTLKAGPCT